MNDILNSNNLKAVIIELNKRNFDKALKLLKKYSNEISDNNLILRLYASIYSKKKDWDNSIYYYKKLLNSETKKFDIFNNLGVSLFNKGRINDSIEAFKSSIIENKNFDIAYDNIGISYKELGLYKLAINNFEKALNLNEKNFSAQKNLIASFDFIKPTNINIHPLSEINKKIINLNNKILKKQNIVLKDIQSFLEKCEKYITKYKGNLKYNETQIFRNNSVNLNCDRHFKVFNEFKIIPEYCFGCYKVQINVKNVVDLIKLFFLLNNLSLKNNNIRKCVSEVRPKISGNYKGYIFCTGISEAKEVYESVKEKINKSKLTNHKVSIKHGCSEFYEIHQKFKEINLDGEQKMNYDSNWREKEKIIDQRTPNRSEQDKKVLIDSFKEINLSDILIIKNWISYANITGDLSYKKIYKKEINSNYLNLLLKDQIEFRKHNRLE